MPVRVSALSVVLAQCFAESENGLLAFVQY